MMKRSKNPSECPATWTIEITTRIESKLSQSSPNRKLFSLAIEASSRTSVSAMWWNGTDWLLSIFCVNRSGWDGRGRDSSVCKWSWIRFRRSIASCISGIERSESLARKWMHKSSPISTVVDGRKLHSLETLQSGDKSFCLGLNPHGMKLPFAHCLARQTTCAHFSSALPFVVNY